jgi:putative ATPase
MTGWKPVPLGRGPYSGPTGPLPWLMTDLWQPRREAARRTVEPLAVRMRPRRLEELCGQQHLLGPGKLLRRMLEADAITSLILHGPPGTGKTTLAELIAVHTRRAFVRENASSVGVVRIREIIAEATKRVEMGQGRTILFLDEIHRFTKSQQDVLLSDVERGLITLVGATTENPLFACNAALVSRSTLFRLEPLSIEETEQVLRAALEDPVRGYGGLGVVVEPEALRHWAIQSDGDARRALTALEVAVQSSQQRRAHEPGQSEHASQAAGVVPIVIDLVTAEDSIQGKAAVYGDDGHYDAASALIKSIRGSDPDAGLYWLARMLEAGEDPRFVARRLAILASEDIGNADPRAVVIAQACWSLLERIGMPEGRITLAQCVTYLALAPKSNASYAGIEAALADVREGRTLPVPLHLRDPNSSPVAGQDGTGVRMRDRTGEKYEYSHASKDALTGQDYLGVEKRYYEPSDHGAERVLRERLEEVRRRRELRRRE